jgi:putative membrane protein
VAFGIDLKPGERGVALFTGAYVLAFTAWFLIRGNYEFVVYVITMLILIALVGRSLRSAEYPLSMLWALSLWGLLHMAGGGVPVGESVLYSAQVVPLSPPDGEWTFLKYDQIVHAYGFGVTAWVLWHLMRRHYPVLDGTWTIYVYPALAAMGLGAVNEIIEFIAVLSVPETNVGGYVNTALDLVFNAAGAVAAMLIVAVTRRG